MSNTKPTESATAKVMESRKRDAKVKVKLETGGYNPKRGASRKAFELYKEVDTILGYLDAVNVAGLTDGPNRVGWDLKRGLISVSGDPKGVAYWTDRAKRSR